VAEAPAGTALLGCRVRHFPESLSQTPEERERTTFVIGADGKISHIFRKVKPAEHDERVLAALTG
jgi:peroxiredoxin